MRKYGKSIGMVLTVFGVMGFLGVMHGAPLIGPKQLDMDFVMQRGAGFIVLAVVGLYFLIFVRPEAPKK